MHQALCFTIILNVIVVLAALRQRQTRLYVQHGPLLKMESQIIASLAKQNYFNCKKGHITLCPKDTS